MATGRRSNQGTDVRRDIEDLRRLLARIEERHSQLAAAGRDTTNAESILTKLRLGLVRALEMLPEWGGPPAPAA